MHPVPQEIDIVDCSQFTSVVSIYYEVAPFAVWCAAK